MKSLKEYITESLDKPMNILYVHGFGSNKNSNTGKYLKDYFKGHKVYTHTFDLLDIDATMSEIDMLIKKYNISLLIGSSFGGFYVLNNKMGTQRLVINPCMKPSVELPKITTVPEDFIQRLEKIESTYLNNIDAETRATTFAIFGKDDELFSYKDLYAKNFNHYVEVSGKHRMEQNHLNQGLSKIEPMINGVKNQITENYIFEHFVNIFTKRNVKDLNIYKDEVYDILVKSYAPIGGLLGINSVEDLIEETDFWKLVTKGGKVVAVSCYKTSRGGRKCVCGCTDGTPEGKEWLYKIITEDIKQKDREEWAEVSGKMEYLYKKFGANPIPAEVAQKILPDKQFLKIHDDGFHYDRMIGGHIETKMMFGNFEK